MKKLLLILLAGIFAFEMITSCNKSDENIVFLDGNKETQDSIPKDTLPPAPDPYWDGPWYYYKSYIDDFVKCDTLSVWYCKGGLNMDDANLFSIDPAPDRQSGMLIRVRGSIVKDPANSYHVQVALEDEPYPVQQEEYDKYSKELGDTAFNKKLTENLKIPVVASLRTLKSVSITSDKSFGKDYPAGTDLSPLFYIIIDDIYATVKNKYVAVSGVLPSNAHYDKNYPQTTRRFRLNEVDLEDYPYISADWKLFLSPYPQLGTDYTLYIQATYTDGTVLETRVKKIFGLV